MTESASSIKESPLDTKFRLMKNQMLEEVTSGLHTINVKGVGIFTPIDEVKIAVMAVIEGATAAGDDLARSRLKWRSISLLQMMIFICLAGGIMESLILIILCLALICAVLATLGVTSKLQMGWAALALFILTVLLRVFVTVTK